MATRSRRRRTPRRSPRKSSAGSSHSPPRRNRNSGYKEHALDLAEDVLTARWRFLENESGADTTSFLPLLISWLTITFVSFGLFAPRNATVLTALFIASLSVSPAVYLLLEMDTPFTGAIVVSSSPLRYALAQLGR
jgi:hypothetical protein